MNPQELSAQELVQLCLDLNQKAAWEEFVRRYQPTIACAVRRSVRRWIRPLPALVDDLVHETYLKLFANNCRALREFDFQHENAIFGFLTKIAANVAMDYIRSSRNKKRWTGKDDLSLDDVFFVAAKIGSAQQAEREIIIQEIDRILKHELINEPNFARDYAIFWLYFRDGFTAKAISKLTCIGMSVKGVESALLRLTKLVRSRMSRAAGQ